MLRDMFSLKEIRNYKFRIYPNREQARKLTNWLETCRVIYNSALADRKNRYERTGTGLTRAAQQVILKADKSRRQLMPNKPARPCRHPYCRALVTDDAYCPAHKKQNAKHYDKQRGTAAQRGYGGRWQRYRLQYLKKHPLCIECERENKLTPANVVDHITPHKGDQRLFWNEDNWQSLCKRCHDIKTAMEDGGFGVTPKSRPNDLLPALMPLVIICGPPGSGKSMLASELATGNDIVIDLDVIKAQVTRTDIYDRYDQKARNAAIIKRNQILYDLGRKRICEKAFFIIGAPTKLERQWWRDALSPAEMVVLETPESVCISRIQADTRRSNVVKEQHISTVKKWWNSYERGDGEVIRKR